MVRDINKPSDNALARTVFLSLGSLEADPLLGSRPIAGVTTQTTFIRADLAVRDWMRAQGIDDTGLVMENGSGLSRLERISAAADGAACCKPACAANGRRNSRPACRSSAVDGTMRRRLHGQPGRRRARA